MKEEKLAVGIDGCKFGWVAVCLQTKEVLLFKTIAAAQQHYPQQTVFFIDIPIGLADAQCNYRNCENEARKLLPKNKKSSIFPVPCREALMADSYTAANNINKKILGVGLSKQTWFIMHKIKEVDLFLTKHPKLQAYIKESHPEIAFQYLHGNQPLQHPKKTKEGIEERLEILQHHHPQALTMYQQALSDYKRAAVQKDDILDAMCLSVVANQPPQCWKTIPEHPSKDSIGIEMGIYYSEIA